MDYAVHRVPAGSYTQAGRGSLPNTTADQYACTSVSILSLVVLHCTSESGDSDRFSERAVVEWFLVLLGCQLLSSEEGGGGGLDANLDVWVDLT